MKFILVLLVILVGVWVWRSQRKAILQNKQIREQQEAERQNAKKTMVSCACCGVHLPQVEALTAPSADLRSQLWFCSTEHRQLGTKT